MKNIITIAILAGIAYFVFWQQDDYERIDRLFDEDAEIHVYRIVQEGVNNILKHSNATEAEIDIEQENGSINVRMHDNGRGFDPSRLQGQQTLGLSGMRERVSILGGKFNIASHIGIGTDISIHLPIGKSANELL